MAVNFRVWLSPEAVICYACPQFTLVYKLMNKVYTCMQCAGIIMNSSIHAAVQTIVLCMILCGSSYQTASPGKTAVFQLSITVPAVKVRLDL